MKERVKVLLNLIAILAILTLCLLFIPHLLVPKAGTGYVSAFFH